MSDYSFIARIFDIHQSGVLTALFGCCFTGLVFQSYLALFSNYIPAWLMPRGTAAVSKQVLCTPFNHAPVYRVTSFKATSVGRLHVCLIHRATCTSGRMTGIFLRVTATTRGWNEYRNKSQHRKSTMEKKIFPRLLRGHEPGDLSITSATF